jgi:hypothetical protein
MEERVDQPPSVVRRLTMDPLLWNRSSRSARRERTADDELLGKGARHKQSARRMEIIAPCGAPLQR